MKVFIQVPDEIKEDGYRLLILNFGEASPSKVDLVDGDYYSLQNEKKTLLKIHF